MRKLRCLSFSLVLVVLGFILATLFSNGLFLYDAVSSREREKILGILGKANLGKAQTAFSTKILCRSRPEYFNHKRIELDPTVVNEVETVLMFIGYPRSGHTLIGSLLDAHPNMVIANEYNILGNWENFTTEHRNKQYLFEQLYTNSYIEAHQGDRSSKDCVPKTKYNYLVPNQWQGKFDGKIKVIGDKKGGSTTKLLNRSQKYWSILEEIRQEVKLPLKFIHVIRNPFDNIATIVLRKLMSSNLNWTEIYKTPVNFSRKKLIKRTHYHMKFAIRNAQLLRHLGDEAYTVRSEDFVANPRLELRKICQFLNIHCSNKYINESTSIVNSKVSRSRKGIIWDDEVKNIMLTYIRRIPFYWDYKFQD